MIKLYKIIKNNTLILYYSNEILLEEDIYFKSLSHIHYLYEKDSAVMIFLKTNKKYRGKGFAKKLIKETINILKKINIKKIELDDMSLFSRTEKSIYRKFNFEYVNPYPEPEMILYI